MKTVQIMIMALFFGLFMTEVGFAQEQITVPLSNPGQPGKLKINLVQGSINVSGYDGNNVVINYNGEGDQEDNDKDRTNDGLRRISGNSAGFEVVENSNEVVIGNVFPGDKIDFNISVPNNFSLKISLVNGGDIAVKNVNGEMEISHVNGDVTLTNIRGSALVNTVNGDITAAFDSINETKPMSFTNVNGDIDVALPENARLSAKMKTEWGDVYTDFQMNIKTSKEEQNTISGSGTYRISVNNWIYGDINGGGPEYLFNSLRGDISIRKK